MKTNQWDVIIIGSGLGGLSSGAFLAVQGKKVLILEQHTVAGGNSCIFRRKKSYQFDVGVHIMSQCTAEGKTHNILKSLGLEKSIEFIENDPEKTLVYLFPDLTYNLPKGSANFFSSLKATFPGENEQLDECIAILKSMLKETAQILELSKEGREAELNTAKMARDFPTYYKWGFKSIKAFFDHFAFSDKLRLILLRETLITCPDVTKITVAQLVDVMSQFIEGIYYPKGGGQVLAASLLDTIKRNGGDFLTGARVDKIICENGKAVGVRLAGGEKLLSEIVISNADIKKTYLQLLNSSDYSPKTARKVSNYPMTIPYFCVNIGIKGDISQLASNSTYMYFPEDSFSLTKAFYTDYSIEKMPLIIVVRSGESHEYSREHSIIQAMTFTPGSYDFWGFDNPPDFSKRNYRKNARYQQKKEEYTGHIVNTIKQIFPGLADKIELADAFTPLSGEYYTGATEGTSFGINAFRRQSFSSEIENLYFAGANTTLGGGILNCILSGIFCDEEIVQNGLIRKALKGELIQDTDAKERPGGDLLAYCINPLYKQNK